ncbi:hypothetical protein C1H46_012185 [Malus baccata]|uniref:Reverse transcriptase Ty1/copia-type domain-containing protein n=1 Tax=Malus baccata TaxID=106549 RepID=A0A540MTR2_MALBA|nr:hypothetical protein C1H46_012185 [Malus baccata]
MRHLFTVCCAHFDLELHQMDVKTTFLNGDLREDIYMVQPHGFIERGKENMVCKLRKLYTPRAARLISGQL